MSSSISIAPIAGFDGYFISDDGRVFSEMLGERKCLVPKKKRNGYLGIALCGSGKIRHRLIHRILLESFVGPCPEGHVCRHLNGIPNDNRLINLAWGTPKQNQADRITHGTNVYLRGEQLPQTRLLKENVLEIRKSSAPSRELAQKFGITKNYVSEIRARTKWAHLPD